MPTPASIVVNATLSLDGNPFPWSHTFPNVPPLLADAIEQGMESKGIVAAADGSFTYSWDASQTEPLDIPITGLPFGIKETLDETLKLAESVTAQLIPAVA